MDQILKDILNAGIALFRSGEDTLTNAINEVQKTYEALKDKGAQDESEKAQQLRQILEDIVSRTQDLQNSAGSVYADSMLQLQEKYQTLMDQLGTMFPEERLTEFKDKFEELARVIKEKVGMEETAAATSAAPSAQDSTTSSTPPEA